VAECRNCGQPNVPNARFCHGCGTTLIDASQGHEVRKTVTVVFADVAGSTSLGERLDPEALRFVMSRYFDEMREVLERHGGTVEKFIGDAVMAVFGVPVVHEDDALRAVRAAAEMLARLETLNQELVPQFGTRLEMRIGVNTGPVVAGDPSNGQMLVTGDAVNLAKRLEQAAPDGSILIGKETYPLVKDAVRAGPLQSFKVKGKADPVSPLRLDAVDPHAAGIARRLDRPFVGRVEELAALRLAFRRVEAEEKCRMFTVLGPAGIGKSRLVTEFVEEVPATVLTGRCLPYGKGISLWPFREIVRELGGAEGLAETLAGEDDAEHVIERVMSAVGASSGSAPADETPWAFRRLLEKLAGGRPVVVVLEDVHWAAPVLLDLVEYLLGWSRGPVFLVCLARPDLLELRAGWVNPRPDADALVLDALAADEADSLLIELQTSPEARARIAEVAEGNPLFLEQIAAMLAERGNDAEASPIPPSIQALLASRLDQLSQVERAVVERAAVVGREFSRAAVTALSPPELEPPLPGALMALVRKELLVPQTFETGQDDGFRFRHILIRDAAYDAVPKKVRADLHERLAEWLENSHEPAADEIIGYHLEQAHGYLADVEGGEHAARMAALAAGRLSAAGKRAGTRGDMPAAADLLSRASALATPKERVELAPERGRALLEAGDLSRASDVLEAAVSTAESIGDRRLKAHAELARLLLYTRTGIRVHPTEVEKAARSAVEIFEEADDDIGLAHAWRRLSDVHWMASRWAAREEALERALEHARRAGDLREEGDILGSLGLTLYWGPVPVAEAISRCRELLAAAPRDRVLRARIQAVVAPMTAMQGNFDEAREYYAESKSLVLDLGLKLQLGVHSLAGGMIELFAGRPDAAEQELREGFELLQKIGATRSLATIAPVLAQAVYAQDRLAEADELTRASEEAAADDDMTSQVLWRAVRAKVAAVDGRPDADELARAAVRLATATDSYNLTGDAFISLAEVARTLGEEETAADAAQQARQLYEAKGNVVSAGRARAFAVEASRLTGPSKQR
jgi:class 3 adenylate cyclase/predicted ATPase